MLRTLSILLLTALLTTGCAQKAENAPATGAAGAPAAASDEAVKQAIAYEHSLTLDAPADKVATLFKTVETLCQQATAEQCVMLDSRLEGSDRPSGRVKVRAKREGIRQIMERLGSEGNIIEQSVTGEDLAAPISDTDKRLAILNGYRARLEALGARTGADLESLMRLNRELAQVQEQIESLTGENANLQRRVATETLTVTIYSVDRTSFWRPIGDALDEFGTNLSEGIATLIIVIAALLPWILVTGFIACVVRRWLARGKRAAAKEG